MSTTPSTNHSNYFTDMLNKLDKDQLVQFTADCWVKNFTPSFAGLKAFCRNNEVAV